MGWAVERFLSPEDRCQSFQRLAGIDYAGGVVGGVDDHALVRQVTACSKAESRFEVLRLREITLTFPLTPSINTRYSGK